MEIYGGSSITLYLLHKLRLDRLQCSIREGNSCSAPLIKHYVVIASDVTFLFAAAVK